ncbi:hypothetical protein KX816_08155 [Sphingosinicellaceae bacterium]|nr:hypothetical protein KX816_08155 [Sphingosinicellaceae bacterium]
MNFDRFVAIDWTGAVGERHRAIAVAEAGASGPPRLVRAGHRWSRAEVFALVATARDAGERALFGIDMCFGLPFADAGTYFPGDPDSPSDARSLWQEVETAAATDPHHAAHSYVEHRRRHFWLGAGDGPRADRARLRVVEQADKARGNTPSSMFVLLGAAQCGKASLSGMRLLAELENVQVWPMDPRPEQGPLLVEIYCRLFAQLGGARGKLRSRAALDTALLKLGSPPCGDTVPEHFDDHIGDALISAAGMRVVATDPLTWAPPGLTPAIAATEGWTFGLA